MTAEADKIDHDVISKVVTVLDRHAPNPHYRVRIFCIDVEDGNRQTLRQVGGEAAGIGIAGIRRKSDQVIDNDVYCSAHGVAAKVCEV